MAESANGLNANPYRCLVPALVGLCLRSVVTAWLEVRSSSRISTSTRNPRRTPGHSNSTRKSRFEFAFEFVEFGPGVVELDLPVLRPIVVLAK